MLMLAALLFSVLVGYARRGRLSRYLEAPLRGLPLADPHNALHYRQLVHLTCRGS